ncbi:MFS transporter [Paecilomyces variotii No. 5]|uniref:MFS transporter n=1 Tax=Byssochlamys spectabilis (strain No. 5 / NBRC 109023) TaxID=1356009 RepID=V5G9A7_BYSSN|nr:MFS transporter [Paecilomyces variotii No. 5]
MTEHEFETTKADAIQTENNAYNPYGILTDEELQLMQDFEGKREKALTRKIDFRILPVFAFLYLLSHVDRSNLGNAKVEGMNADLGLVGNQYNVASTLFFIPYILFGKVTLKSKPKFISFSYTLEQKFRQT